MEVFVYLGVGVVIVIAFMLWIVYSAPAGYQDDTGFHYGIPEENNIKDDEFI